MYKYLPTIADLIDRLCIITLKSIKMPKHRKEYEKEAKLIMHDLGLKGHNGQLIRAIQVNAIANETIWENESEARKGGKSQDKMLKYTHSINGVRNNAKNVISQEVGERKDLKTDCLAADLIKEKGYNWEIW